MLHRGVYYAASPGFPCHQWLVDHYAEAVAPDPPYFDALKALRASMIAYSYNSATDDYTLNDDGFPHQDGLRVAAAAASLGVPLESCYLHWAEDTTVMVWLSGDPGPTPCFYPAGSRIELYRSAHQSGKKTRHACCFLPVARPVQTKVMLEVAQIVSPGGRQWDGLFLDNCGSVLYAWGSPLVSGGTVAECGLKIGTAAFNSWHWTNLRDWLEGFRVAMRALSPARLVAINVANSWTDEYCTHPVADRLVEEFVGNPIRDTWPAVSETARKHQLAQTNGVGIWASANPALGTPPETWEEMQYAALCLHLAVQQPLSSTHIQDWTGPNRADWPQRVVSPVEANHQFTLLGAPTSDLGLWVPINGKGQHLWARNYERGAVLVRNMEPWNGATTDVWTVPRPSNMIYIGPDGVNSTPANLTIKNGGGAILFH